MKKVVDKTYAKSKDYKKTLEAIEKTDKCPFCKDNFKYHKKKILKKESKWFITESSWPYKNSKFHFLIISKQHKEEFNNLKTSDFKAVSYLANWAIKKYRIKGGALSLRFGDTKYTGASVYHLHFHFIVPKLDKSKKARAVNFPIG
ncbi:MAG: HIT domain-containing protein [Candidatus Pacebacteria bacterium]|nr:HIT domain-containing protein [Candidatus Paceibacterota bacterium]